MEITVNHVITLSPEVEKFINSLISGKALLVTATEPEKPKKEKIKVEKTDAIAAPDPATVVSIPTPVTQADISANLAAEKTASVHKMEDVRARAQEIAKAHDRDKVKAALTALGAANVPAMDAKHYDVFLEAIESIKDSTEASWKATITKLENAVK